MPIVVAAALFAVVAFAVVIWPRVSGPSGLSVPVGRAGNFLSTVPTLPGAAPTQPDGAAPADPPPTAVVQTDAGNNLRVGVAGVAPSPATIADAVGSRIGLYSQPGEAQPDDTLDNPTWEGLPVVFLVMGRNGDWLQVQVSMRPNEATAWIKASDVTLRQTAMHIYVDTPARQLTVYDGSQSVMQISVAPGTGGTPTPTGNFFVDGIAKPPDPNGPYGAFQVSVAAFSNVLTTFDGGDGQIAIHGTNDPGLIGTPASHGCVRLTNADITRLVSMIPIGTPVQIV